jgi:hypothetical protein
VLLGGVHLQAVNKDHSNEGEITICQGMHATPAKVKDVLLLKR